MSNADDGEAPATSKRKPGEVPVAPPISDAAARDAETLSPRTIWAMWVALWDRRESVNAVALARILVGLVLVIDIASTYQHDLVTHVYGNQHGYGSAVDAWPRALFGTDPGPALVDLSFVLAICILFGIATPVALVGYALVGAQLGNIAAATDQGVYPLLRICVVLLALGRCHARWSVDAFVLAKLGRPPSRIVPAWPRYLLMTQLVWMYCSGGMNKSGAAWGPFGGFTAIENIVADPNVARFAPGWITPYVVLARLATAATIVFELCAPIYLLAYYFAETPGRGGRMREVFRKLRIRWVWIALGLSFHLGIAITLHLGAFPWGMLALYPVLLRPSELQGG